MIDLWHWHLEWNIFKENIKLYFPDFLKTKLLDYTKPWWDPELLNIFLNRFENINIGNLTLTLSTNLSFNIILNKISLEWKKIHVPRPTFSCFYNQLKSFNNKVILYNNFNFKEIYDNVDNWDYLLLVNPSNPTGLYINKDNIKEIMEKLFHKNVKIILDATWIFSVYGINNHEEELNDLILSSIKYNHILLIWISKMLYSPWIRLSCLFWNIQDVSYVNKYHDMLAVSCSYFDQEFAKFNLFKNYINYNSINKLLFDNSNCIIDFIKKSSVLSIDDYPQAWMFLVIKSKIYIDFYDMNINTW